MARCDNPEMAGVLASAHLSDEEFLAAFHACQLKTSEFKNLDHFRLAWLHLHREPLETAIESVCSGIRDFAAHYGVSEKYHSTITTGWVRLLATHRETTFEEFLAGNAERLKVDLLHRFWSPELLASDRARYGWAPPDLRDLPSL
jgi:hypothetical protein